MITPPGWIAANACALAGTLVSAPMGACADALRTLERGHPPLEVVLLAGQSADFMTRAERGEPGAAEVTQPPTTLPATLTWILP